MSRQLFRLLLLCQLLLFFLHLWMVHRGAIPETPLFREFQGFVWRAIPRWRIFFGLHALVFSVASAAIGFALLAMLRPSGRLLFALSIVSYLAYLRLEPRFQPEEWRFIGAIFAGTVGGVLTALASTAGSHWGAVLRGVLGLALSFGLFRFARGVEPFTGVPQPWELSTFGVFFGAGYILLLSWCGSVAADFQTTVASTPEWTPKRIARGLAVHFCGGGIAVAAAVSVAGAGLLWMAVVPFAPVIVALYAPISWFRATGDTVVFSSQLGPGFDLALRNRLLLGILFQYLLLGVAWALMNALRFPSKRSAIVAHVSLLLYWFPALWLCQMINRHGVQ